jgi:hypothetical protein
VAQQYNLVAGQQFTVTTANGQQMSLVYADNTADYLSGRVDIYDPFGQLANDGAAVISINGGPIVANNGSDQPGGGWISKIADSLTIGIRDHVAHERCPTDLLYNRDCRFPNLSRDAHDPAAGRNGDALLLFSGRYHLMAPRVGDLRSAHASFN